MTMCKNELNAKALELKKELEDKNINVHFDEASFRDYLVKININQKGIIKETLYLYYKPSKHTYSLKKQIKNPELDFLVDSIWNKLNGFETYDTQNGIYEAFVDGSYINEVTGYASVIYLGDTIKAELYGTVENTQSRQFGGELKSVIETLKWCKVNNIKEIRINYDYTGIENFATGKWQAKNELALEYINFIRETDIKIQWRHIKSHTGNIKNNRADILAKKAATF
ncbi:MAG: hypothetical protein LBF23_00015 [Endomicrobium sp.]|jgi:ribonuclease HI|nr:hypothetical protein [Endomicrobium sp.]